MTEVQFDHAPADIVQAVDDVTANVPPLAVTVTDPARVILMPAQSAGMRQFTLSTTVPVKVLDRDPRRKRAVVTLFDTGGTSDGARLAGTQAATGGPTSFLLPLAGPGIAAGNVASGPLEITSMDEVWALAQTAACTLSVLSEQWAS